MNVKVTFIEKNSLTPIPNLGVKFKKVDIQHGEDVVLDELTTDASGSIYFPKSRLSKNEDKYIVIAYVGTGYSSSANADDYLAMSIQIHKTSKDLVSKVYLSGTFSIYTFPNWWDTKSFDSLEISTSDWADTLSKNGDHYFGLGDCYPNRSFMVNIYSIDNGIKQFIQTENYQSRFAPDCSSVYLQQDSSWVSTCTNVINF